MYSKLPSMKKNFVQALSKLSNKKGKRTTSHYESTNKTQASKSKTSQRNSSEQTKSSKEDRASLIKATKISQVFMGKKDKAKSNKETYAKSTWPTTLCKKRVIAKTPTKEI